MRIYGGKDYYDSVVAWGQDPKTVLVRSMKLKFPAKRVPLVVETFDLAFQSRGPVPITHHWVVVVFCNKIYRGLAVTPTLGANLYFWNAEKLQAWAEENKVVVSERNSWRSRRADLNMENCMDVLPVKDILHKFMLEHRLAILLDTNESDYREHEILANPHNLKLYGFAKALDPFTAHQELSMWISGVLGGQSPETVYITDDKVLLESHGFDKHSFRSSTRG